MTPEKEHSNQQQRVEKSTAAVGVRPEVPAVASATESGEQSGQESAKVATLDTPLPATAKTDEHLMLAYASGDAAAFEVLYNKYRPALFRFFLAAVTDDWLANELYQETWIKVIGARAKYQPKAAFSTWLFTIARNNLWDYFRKFQPHVVEFDTVAEFNEEADLLAATGNVELQPDELAVLAQQSLSLQRALDQLPLKQREVMLLRYIAGMTLAEIAISIEEKQETVKSRLRYATVKLKNDLKHSLAENQRLA